VDPDIVLKSFRLKKVLTIEDLTSLLKRSVITARRFLKRHGCFTSINKNARYYTLSDIPEFDNDGLWNYKGIIFSRLGNLRETLIQLIEMSDMGLSVNEIENLVGLPNKSSYMSTFKHGDDVKRETIGGSGTGRFIYFALESEKSHHQRVRRLASITSLPSDSDAITILVELIRHPNSSPTDLATILLNKGEKIDSHSIERLLIHHRLEKKTPE
jgi:hypothetical protein